MGELVEDNFPKIPELLSYLDLEVLTEDDCYIYEEMYATKLSYSLKEICELLRSHYIGEEGESSVYTKTRHNIGKVYKQLTGKELTRNYNYRFDKLNCLFALFVLDSTAKEIGCYKVFGKKPKELTTDDLLDCLDQLEEECLD